MRRLWFLLIVALAPGCAGFEEYYYEGPTQEVYAPAASCQTAPVLGVSASTGLVPSVSTTPTLTTMSGAQTREPELAVPRR